MRYILIVILVLTACLTFGQNFYVSVPGGGTWTNDATWDLDGDGIDVGTDGVPGPNDFAVIIGDGAGGGNVNITSNVTVGDLFLQFDNPSVLSKTGFPQTRILTINGQLGGFDFYGAFDFASPTVAVIENDPSLNIVITGDNLSTFSSNPIIAFWSDSAPLRNLTFNPTSSSTNIQIEDLAIFSGSVCNVNNGTLTINNGFSLSQTGAATLTVASNANLVVNGAINGDGTTSTLFNQIINNGTISIGTNGYANTDDLTLAPTSFLNVGNNQPNGWYHADATAPSSISIDPASTVRYNRTSTQNIPAFDYGNLEVSSGGNAITKNLLSTGTLTTSNLTIGGSTTFITSANSNVIFVNGNLQNNGIFAPSQEVIFQGSLAQTINGSSTTTFNGGIQISNALGVSLDNIGADINGLLDVDPGSSFSPSDQVITMSGNMLIDGTLIAGTDPGGFVFDGNTTFQGGGSRNFNDVTITGTVNAPAGTLNIIGDWDNTTGTFNRGSGTVAFNGTGQTISGTTAFNNMTIAGTVTNTGTIELHGTFTPTSGSFNTGGDFTVMSTSLTDEGRIGAFTGAFTFTGNMTTQRFVDGISDGDWRYFSSPVIGATLNNWLTSGMPITGNFSDASPAGVNNVVSQTAPSVYVRNSAAGTWDPVTGATTSAVALTNGQGYSAYTYVDGDLTLSTTGTLSSGNKTINLTGAGGVDPFYLIGNPYPSAIDWDLIHAANPALGTTVFIRIANNVYASYNQASGTGANHPNGSWAGEIAMGQSFWVDNTAATGSVSLTESMKASLGNGSFLRDEGPATDVLKLKLVGNDEFDETVIFLADGATDAFDAQFDGKKQLNGYYSGSLGYQDAINLASFNSVDPNETFVFNGIDGDVCSKEIGLEVRDVPEGTYSLEVPLSTVGAYSVKLVDVFAGQEMTISAGSIYEFEVTADVASKGKDRFKIVIESTSADAVAEPLATINNNCESEQLLVQLSQASDGFNYVLRNSDNEDVSNIVQAESGVAYISLDKSHLSNGANEFSVYVNSPSSCAGSKLFDGIVTYNLSSIAEITNVEGAITCDGNTGELELSAAGAPSDGFYRWYESEEALMAISGQNSENFVVTGVDVSKSYYVSAVNANGCEGARVEVKIENVPLSSPSVADGEFCSEGMVTLNAEGAIGNQFYKWYENATTEEAIEGENGSKFTSPFLSNSRSYFVSIANATGCESDRVEVIANVNVNRPTPPSIQNSNVCSGSSATLTASGALDGEFYRWYTSMDAVDPIADENGNILILNEVSANKDYYVSKVNGAGCESVRSLAKVVVTSLDVPEITISGLLMSVPEGFSYQWFKDGSPIEGATSSTYMASEMGGEFNVEISDGICTVMPTLPVSIDAVTAIDDILYNLGLNIYPNPVEDRLNIKKLKSQNFTLNLYDLKGDLILSNEDLVIQGSNSYFNTSVLNKGVYILVVEYDVNHLAPVKILKK